MKVFIWKHFNGLFSVIYEYFVLASMLTNTVALTNIS